MEQIRSVALIGHSDSGKTLLAEALLQHGGSIASMGSLERGDTLCGSDPMEREYHHFLAATLVHFEHEGTYVRLIDTPGYPDFIGRALPAASCWGR